MIGGARYADAPEACDAYVAESGALRIHPFDAESTIAGQGTTALEWEQTRPALDTVLVAVGGGGLISGVASWWAGRVKVVGVEPEGSRALHAALEAGRPVNVDVDSVAADSLGARPPAISSMRSARRRSITWRSSLTMRIRDAQRPVLARLPHRLGARRRSGSGGARLRRL